MAAQRSVIYLSGTDARQLEVAEKRCAYSAQRFGWHILGTVRDGSDRAALPRLVGQIRELNIQVVMTGSLDMLAPDQASRDELLATIERCQCFVQPVTRAAA
jgi:hypothetical protein